MSIATPGRATVDGHRISYAWYGEPTPGRAPIVLLHALLMSRHMQHPLATRLADRGHYVLCPDLLGTLTDLAARHTADQYSTGQIARRMIGLLDELEIAKAIVGGTSIGTTVALEMAVAAPERVSSLIVEGPPLEDAAALVLPAAAVLAPLRAMRPVLKIVAATAERAPVVDLVLIRAINAFLAQDPDRALAFLRGLAFGRVAPSRSERRALTVPALIVDSPIDVVHPNSDARRLSTDMPAGELITSLAFLPFRFTPSRLADQITTFIQRVEDQAPSRHVRLATNGATVHEATGSKR